MKFKPLLLKIMKFSFYGIVLQCLFLSVILASSGNAQQKQQSVKEVYMAVSLSNASLFEVFQQIEAETNFIFNYDERKLRNNATRINISGRKTVAEILLNISESANLKFKQVNNNINVEKLGAGKIKESEKLEILIQARNISGTVTAYEDGEPLPGVNIIEKGTTNGVVTNVEGEYNLNVSPNAVLVFSSVGYTTEEITVGNRSVVNLTMTPDIQQLQELVVIGYGSVKKSDLTGAVASVSAEELEKVPITSLDQGLSGRAPGVQVTQASAAPGGGVTIRIRGGNSINSGNEPLFVIDGFPIYSDNDEASQSTGAYPVQSAPNALATINPNDIESIEILKDASATAIYGSRGANGVVLITTKRGKEGAPKFNLNSYMGVQSVAKKIDLLNAQEFAQLYDMAQVNSGADPAFDGTDFPLIEDLGAGTDWQEEIFRTAQMQNHQLGVTGGTDVVKYAISLNYFDQEGVVVGSRFQRASVRSNFDIKLTEKFRVGANLNYNYSIGNIAQSESSNTGANMGLIGAALHNAPVHPVYNDEGKFFSKQDASGPRLQDNPVAIAMLGKDVNLANRFLNNFQAEYDVLKGMTAKVSFGSDLLNGRRNAYFPRQTRRGDRSDGFAQQSMTNKTSWQTEALLSYNKEFNQNHRINVIGGYTYQQQDRFNNQIISTTFINDILEDNDIGAGANPQIPSSGRDQWQIASWLGRLNYSLNNKYLFTFSGRADGSSRFGEDNRWAFFPSVALAYRLGQEEFIKNSNLFSDIKIRTSYGISGNTQIRMYQSLARMALQSYAIGNNLVTGYGPNSIANPDLKWETTNMFNIGLDLALFDDRIQLNSNYYYNKTEDLLMNVVIPSSYGFRSTFKNSGSMRNYGFEFSLDAFIVHTNKFKWNSNVNWSMNRNKILSIGESEPFFARNISSGANISGAFIDEGLILGSWKGRLTNGIYQNLDQVEEDAWADENDLGKMRFKDINGDGKLNNDDLTIIGDPEPDFIWGWNNNFSYGNFELNIFINGVQGNDIVSPGLNFLASMRPRISNQVREFSQNPWTPENPNTNTPMASRNDVDRDEFSDFYIHDGSFIRLRNVRLAYSLPQNRYFDNATIYLSGQNLITITDYWGYDPEVNSQGQNNINQGVDKNSYPNARIYTVGVNLGF
ncbi:MAG: SusC/RagA family TonB-linked outer membrane protein [Candidatus Cyclobacteriaceae bacterium M3_2C_046]